MKLIKISAIHGPNVFHNKPILLMKIDLQHWADQSSQEFRGFTDTLINAFPGLLQHTCSPGYIGGFHERLLRGTYLAHIIEHVAIEFSCLSGIPVHFGKTVFAGSLGTYNIVVRFNSEDGMKQCLQSAFMVVESIILKNNFSVEDEVRNIRTIVAATQLGPSTEAIIQAATKKQIPVQRIGGDSLLRLGYGKNIRYVQAAVTDRTSSIAVDLVQDKSLTKSILLANGIRVPQGVVVSDYLMIEEFIKLVEFPCVVKPVDGHHGQGVCLNLSTVDEVIHAISFSKKFSKNVLIEKMCSGRDYRVLVVDGKMVAAAERIPPMVVGDGVMTVAQLIEKLNCDPRRSEGHSKALSTVVIDEILLKTIASQGADLVTVLENGSRVLLRENANLSSGGTAEDVTALVHPEVQKICERIARLVGLDICGVDLIHSNISQPPGLNLYVIEVNAGPGLRMHLFPDKGVPQPVGQKIIDMIYPSPDKSRIPIIGVTGTNGKTSTVRMLRKVFSTKPHTTVGMTSSDGIWIGDEKVAEGDTSGPTSASIVLADPKVDIAILELARGGLLRGGLAFDRCDIGIVTNIRPDHLGQDGIDDIEGLIKIKSLVIEHVKENGNVILNADDENALGLMKRQNLFKVSKNVILYSLNPYNPALVKHLNQLKDACWLQDDIIHMMYRHQLYRLGYASQLPVTMNGAARFQISNVLAVVSAALSSDCEANSIYTALMEFNPVSENSGRINLYKLHQGYVLLDYAHNPDGLEAVGEMLSNFKSFRKTAVLGMPGDRTDELIIAAAKVVAKYFDRIVLRDDIDLRGRKPSEVPRLLKETIERYHQKIQIEIIPDEGLAIQSVLSSIKADELVVLFYDNLEYVMKTLRQFDPKSVNLIQSPDTSLYFPAGHISTKPVIKVDFTSVVDCEIKSTSF